MIMSNPVSNNPHASAISEAKETFSNLLELSQLLNTGNLSLLLVDLPVTYVSCSLTLFKKGLIGIPLQVIHLLTV
jgi:hypothetical protein